MSIQDLHPQLPSADRRLKDRDEAFQVASRSLAIATMGGDTLNESMVTKGWGGLKQTDLEG